MTGAREQVAVRHPDEPAAFAARIRSDAVSVFEEMRSLAPAVRCAFPVLGEATVLWRREDVAALLAADGTDVSMAPVLAPLAPFFGTRSVMCLDGDAHLDRRRLVLPAFHGAALPAMEAEVRELARGQFHEWDVSEPVTVLPRTQALTFAAILRVGFGIRDPVRARVAGDALRAHFIAANRGETRDQAPIEPLLQGLLDERRAAGHEGADLLGLLLAARDEHGRGLDDATLRDELLTALTAGHETTAGALAWSADLLARRPEVVRALHEERAVGRRDLLDAVIAEILRLRPPLIGMARVALRDIEIGGVSFRAGEQLMASSLLVHLDPDRHPDPRAFRPDRFLGVRPARLDWIPFGGGRHRCAGAAFAQLELRVVLEELLDAFDLEAMAPPADVGIVVNTHVPRGGVVVRFRRRH